MAWSCSSHSLLHTVAAADACRTAVCSAPLHVRADLDLDHTSLLFYNMISFMKYSFRKLSVSILFTLNLVIKSLLEQGMLGWPCAKYVVFCLAAPCTIAKCRARSRRLWFVRRVGAFLLEYKLYMYGGLDQSELFMVEYRSIICALIHFALNSTCTCNKSGEMILIVQGQIVWLNIV